MGLEGVEEGGGGGREPLIVFAKAGASGRIPNKTYMLI